MRAFHNNPEIKDKYLARIVEHYFADEIMQGKYWENGRGCAVGCTIHSSAHDRYETELGIPTALARLQDKIFEGLPLEEAKRFPQEFLEAIPVGADLSNVACQFLYYCVSSCREHADRQGQDAIDTVLTLLERQIQGDTPTQEEWNKAAESAAWSAAYAAYAAYSTTEAYQEQRQVLLQLLRETGE